MDRRGPGEGDHLTGDPNVGPPDPEDEFTSRWRKLGLQPDRGQVNLVMENRRKIQGRVEEIWQELRLAIIETFRD